MNEDRSMIGVRYRFVTFFRDMAGLKGEKGVVW